MVKFGRVEGVIRLEGSAVVAMRLSVTLDQGQSVATIRDEIVPELRRLETDDDVIWHVDQYTQETIGTVLAEGGWEAFGVGETPESEPGGPYSSPPYVVRNLSY